MLSQLDRTTDLPPEVKRKILDTAFTARDDAVRSIVRAKINALAGSTGITRETPVATPTIPLSTPTTTNTQ